MKSPQQLGDFWERAPALFQQVEGLTAALATSSKMDDVRAVVREIAASIPETPEPLSGMDPYLRDALLTAVIHSMRAEKDQDRRELRVAVERIRQALRDLLDERPVWRDGPKDAAVWLRGRGLSVADLVELLGTSETSVRRWTNPEDESAPSGEMADRVVVLAKIVNHLRHAMTAKGVVQWFQRPHPALDDRRPIDELKDVPSYLRLVHLASGTRSFVAT